MTKSKIRFLYTATISTAAVVIGTTAVWLWPLSFEPDRIWMPLALVLITVFAGRFPFKISPQSDATLVTIPLFMAVLLLHPLESAVVVSTGVMVSELWLKAPPRAYTLNISANGLTAGIAGIVFWTLRPESSVSMFDPGVGIAAVVTGVVIFSTDLLIIGGMVTLVKGVNFWKRWKESWVFESILDSSQLAIGLMGAQLVSSAGWTLAVLALPVIVAHYAFSRSVKEVVNKTNLAAELDNKLEELKATQSQLIQSAKLATVGTLAAGVAHDINNPLTVIIARGELLLAKLKVSRENVDVDKTESGIHDMYVMATRISTIVNQMLTFSRRSGDLTSLVALSDLMDDALPLIERKFEKKKIELIRQYEDTPMVDVVPNQLHQVFMNLVGNAVDAMPEDGSITIGCKLEDGMAVGYVADTGTGIPQDVLDKIFEPFFTTKEVGKGTGLGLFICHKIITDLGGELSVDSTLGEGTTFWVRLPAKTGSEHRGPLVEVST